MDSLERQRLAHTLRHLRVGKGLRQIDLAIPGQISRSAISALERAQINNPSKQLITAVAAALDVRYDDLVRFSDTEASVIAVLHGARQLWGHDPKKALQNTQRVLRRARHLQLYDVEREAAALLAEWYGLRGDPFRAMAYTIGALIRPETENSTPQATVMALATHLREQGEGRAALALYREFLFGLHRANPRFARVFLHLGRTYMEAHQYPQAVRAFGRAHRDATALGQADVRGWAFVGLSRALGFTGRHVDATTAINQAEMLAVTYHWSDLKSAVLRTHEILDLLFSRSLPDARQQWHWVTQLLQNSAEPVQDQIDLLQSWIDYASRHKAWEEVRLAADSGLALLKASASVSNRGAKGHFLWARSEANEASGQPWEQDREWSADLLHLDVGPTRDFSS